MRFGRRRRAGAGAGGRGGLRGEGSRAGVRREGRGPFGLGGPSDRGRVCAARGPDARDSASPPPPPMDAGGSLRRTAPSLGPLRCPAALLRRVAPHRPLRPAPGIGQKPTRFGHVLTAVAHTPAPLLPADVVARIKSTMLHHFLSAGPMFPHRRGPHPLARVGQKPIF